MLKRGLIENPKESITSHSRIRSFILSCWNFTPKSNWLFWFLTLAFISILVIRASKSFLAWFNCDPIPSENDTSPKLVDPIFVSTSPKRYWAKISKYSSSWVLYLEAIVVNLNSLLILYSADTAPNRVRYLSFYSPE